MQTQAGNSSNKTDTSLCDDHPPFLFWSSSEVSGYQVMYRHILIYFHYKTLSPYSPLYTKFSVHSKYAQWNRFYHDRTHYSELLNIDHPLPIHPAEIHTFLLGWKISVTAMASPLPSFKRGWSPSLTSPMRSSIRFHDTRATRRWVWSQEREETALMPDLRVWRADSTILGTEDSGRCEASR